MSTVLVSEKPATAPGAGHSTLSTARPERVSASDRREDAAILLLALALNAAMAVYLLHRTYIFSDGMSRVANGYYVVFSRDPHLPAVGFVWMPLPSLAALPILLLSPLMPVLHTMAAAGNVVSAVCGALSVVLMARALRLVGTSRWLRYGLVAAFSLHPLVLLAAGEGASEPMLVCLLMGTAVCLLRWLRDGVPGHLVGAGVLLALAYGARYEALAAGAAVVVLVFCITWFGRGEARRMAAVNDAMLVGLPFVFTFALWALASKIIVNEWFATFSSAYGNSAQVTNGRTAIQNTTGSTGVGPAASYLWHQALVVAPAALPLAVLAVLLVVWRRPRVHRLDVLVIGACFASVLAFDWLTFVDDKSFGWLRFQVTSVPLEVMLIGWLGAQSGRWWRRVAALLTVAALIWSPVSWRLEFTHPGLAAEEALMRHEAADGQNVVQRQIGADLDARGLPDGSVLTDVAYSFPIVMGSRRPHQFVITPDRDFAADVADPHGHHVDYALVTVPAFAPADAVEKRYPGMYDHGGGVATLVQQWSVNGGSLWRLYRFNR